MSHDHENHHHSHNDGQYTSDIALRVKALESLLVEKNLIDPKGIDLVVELYEHKIGPRNGARVVAKAWSDPDYRARLLNDGPKALAELGYSGLQGEETIIVENTPSVHNVTVCTLCSCYPWPTLGLPPNWYKDPAYRSRVVIDPRSVLSEFGLTIPSEVEVRVWDSNAELRYLVLPMRPVGTEGLSEDELAELVTRDSMIGTGIPLSPGESVKGGER
ncbi:nitrile hydratase subunit alpha [Agrobacterium tumefaciens]|uniref:nitrile hydratase subunit alpha n=1 Tax=Agrobacterium tumefaciens TaxID=358 RepID=UPI001574C4E4|nr:nitrile hydratase subunit alpha [Agrobacterium tumefaciens]NTB94906.1 nitrile hydratase subunit alpha [Agrobacterium tumefaciens]NTC44027.1 nitrile hydratase subunit alpha [Agrobacterium tumefaciens]